MKKIGFLGLFLLTILVFAVVLVSKSEGAIAATTSATATATKLDKDQLMGMIKPTLEVYMDNHPDPQVRIWSMVILANFDKIDEQKISSIPVLVRQLGSKDENVRQIALNSIRGALTLDEKEWKGIMGTVFRTIAKTTKYPGEDGRKLAIKSLGMLQDLDEESLNSLQLLFDMTQDADSGIRQAVYEAIAKILSAKETSSGGVGGGSAGGQIEAPGEASSSTPSYTGGQ